VYKVVLAGFIILVLSSGCATKKRATDYLSVSTGLSGTEIIKRVAAKNLTTTGFFIQKGKITTSGETGRISLYFTMKYSSDGKYLISLRSKSGIEAFRIYLSRDTILVNDRLKRNVLYGKSEDFEKITGLPAALLKISVGDLFINRPLNLKNINCVDDEIRIDDYFFGINIISTISCNAVKLKSVNVSTGEPGKYIIINYLKWREDTYTVPHKVEINDSGRKIKITISIDKYLAPWVGELDFIPGTGYKSKPLI
jgi:outer membrane biogenesis lipoprotein LolB